MRQVRLALDRLVARHANATPRPSCAASAWAANLSGGAGADQVALYIGQAAEDTNHQAARRRRRIRPSLGERAEL
jgi:hypothetical protein